jgi:hypothetical protein
MLVADFSDLFSDFNDQKSLSEFQTQTKVNFCGDMMSARILI